MSPWPLVPFFAWIWFDVGTGGDNDCVNGCVGGGDAFSDRGEC